MEVLNLDSFAQVKRQITLGGVKHDVLELSVQTFINNLKAAEKAEGEGGKLSLSQQVEASVDAILESVPTLPREELLKRPIDVLHAILTFIRGDLDPAERAKKEATDKGEPGKPGNAES